MTTTSTRSTPPATPVVPELPADLTAGLRRLKLSTIRGIAAAVMLTAKTRALDPGGAAAHPDRS